MLLKIKFLKVDLVFLYAIIHEFNQSIEDSLQSSLIRHTVKFIVSEILQKPKEISALVKSASLSVKLK